MRLVLTIILFLFIKREVLLCEKSIIYAVMEVVAGQIDENALIYGGKSTKVFELDEGFNLKNFKIENQIHFEEGISFTQKPCETYKDLSFLTEDYNYKISSRPEAVELGYQDIYLIIFSPILSEDRRFAIVQYSYGCGPLCGNSEQLILKRNPNKDNWIIIARQTLELV